MNKPTRTGSHKYYKGKYSIAFYDKTGEEYLYGFDNIRDILKFQNKPITRENVGLIKNYLYNALKTDTHFVRFLTGEVMTVWIIDEFDD